MRCIYNELQLVDKYPSYSWRTAEAEEITHEPELTKSWEDFRVEVKVCDQDQIPAEILQRPSFLQLFWLIYPHRLTVMY